MAVSDIAGIMRQVAEQERQGSLLGAYDLIQQALQRQPDDVALRHRALLILARGGATDQAERSYRAFGFDDVTDHEDIIALGGRLLKDRALVSSGHERLALAQAAIGKYRQAFALRQSCYPAINIAALRVLRGEIAQAALLAEWVLAHRQPAPDYFDLATRAEAQLVLGRVAEADACLEQAVACEPFNIASRASTLRQLELLSGLLGCDTAWLDPHRPPSALHYCGHMFAADGDAAQIEGMAAELRREIADQRPAALFGSLAAGCDLLAAEAALELGIDLHVVLPFEEAEFLRCSVAPWGTEWLPRYDYCRSRAASFRIYLPEPYLGDEGVFTLGSAYAMGLAIRHAQANRSKVGQVCVWDGAPSERPAGTAADQQVWGATGLPQRILDFPAQLRQAPPLVAPAELLQRSRQQRAILFGDVRGFSALSERQAQIFFDSVMGGLAERMQLRSLAPDLMESWGDGLHLVFDDVGKAAAAALALQDYFRTLPLARLGLPEQMALRIGAHCGPLTPMRDPLTGKRGFFGTHNTIAARIEPVAMPGTIFASEPFAAMLALGNGERFLSGYVGITDLPKGFGAMRLFSIQQGRIAP